MSGPGVSVTTKRSGEDHPHRNQSPFEWVQDETKAFQGGRTEQRLVALLLKDHWGWTKASVDLKVGVTDTRHRRSGGQIPCSIKMLTGRAAGESVSRGSPLS